MNLLIKKGLYKAATYLFEFYFTPNNLINKNLIASLLEAVLVQKRELDNLYTALLQSENPIQTFLSNINFITFS